MQNIPSQQHFFVYICYQLNDYEMHIAVAREILEAEKQP